MTLMRPIRVSGPLERIFDDVQKDLEIGMKQMQRIFGQPDANLLEHSEHYEIQVAVPGLDKEELDVSVKNQELVVSASAKKLIDSNAQAAPQFRFREFGFSGFKRAFTLPRDVDTSNISAKCEKGVLILTLPKIVVSNTQIAIE